jgi:hypothetical protein
VGDREVLLEPEGFPEFGDGLVQLALARQGYPEDVMSPGTLRPEGHGSRPVADCLLQVGRLQLGQTQAKLEVEPEIGRMPSARLAHDNHHPLGRGGPGSQPGQENSHGWR